jgi:hypothetical protein
MLNNRRPGFVTGPGTWVPRAAKTDWGFRTSRRREQSLTHEGGEEMIGILIAIVLAAVAYWICLALGLPAIVALIAAVLVLLSGVPTGGYGLGSRWGGRRGTL